MLVILSEQLHTCRFGTFLMDSDKERHECQVHLRSTSVWSFLERYRDAITQDAYTEQAVLLPDVSSLLRGVSLWSEVHMRWAHQRTLPELVHLVSPEDMGIKEHGDSNWSLSCHVLNTIRREKYGASGVKLQRLQKELDQLREQMNKWKASLIEENVDSATEGHEELESI